MNCDQVFDHLTRGPFPSGNPDDARVEAHLEACYECRELSDALRPAVGLFHESMAAEEQVSLPGYHGARRHRSSQSLPTTVTRLMRETYANGPPSHCGSGRTIRHVASWRAAATAAIVLVLSGVGWWIGKSDPRWFGNTTSSQAGTAQLIAMPAFQPSGDGQVILARLTLSDSCFGDPMHAEHRTDSNARLACCTGCHNSDRPRHPPIDSLVSIVATCGVCHSQDES